MIELKPEMNLVETDFFNAYHSWVSTIVDTKDFIPQAEIGKYRADFLYDNRYVVEIDGKGYHESEYHRQKDYERERYLVKHGYKIIRFTASEVARNAYQCVTEMMEVVYSLANIREDHQRRTG